MSRHPARSTTASRLGWAQGAILAILTTAATTSAAETLEARSGPERVPMVELFTSQGCSSCPPAERWLSGLKDRAGLWDAFIPIAWHVDYWDDLGWPDRFAAAAYTDRQRRYAAIGRTSGVYTPGIISEGAEQRRWYAEGLREPAGVDAGRLDLSVIGDRATLAFDPGPDAGDGPWRAHVAVLGVGFATDVKRGENRGRTLQEDFVVMGHAVGGIDARQWQLELPDTVDAQPQRRAVVAWLARDGDPAPVQAVAGWVTR